jgi:hypothetical protein
MRDLTPQSVFGCFRSYWCPPWSQTYDGNSSYLSSVANGLGLLTTGGRLLHGQSGPWS